MDNMLGTTIGVRWHISIHDAGSQRRFVRSLEVGDWEEAKHLDRRCKDAAGRTSLQALQQTQMKFRGRKEGSLRAKP